MTSTNMFKLATFNYNSARKTSSKLFSVTSGIICSISIRTLSFSSYGFRCPFWYNLLFIAYYILKTNIRQQKIKTSLRKYIIRSFFSKRFEKIQISSTFLQTYCSWIKNILTLFNIFKIYKNTHIKEKWFCTLLNLIQ